MKRMKTIISVIALTMVLAACGRSAEPSPPEGPAEQPPAAGEGRAYINNIDIVIMESFPVQVTVVIQGDLSDGCTNLRDTDTVFDAGSNTFTIEMQITHDGEVCTEALVPFERRVPLEVEGLDAGTYIVVVGEDSATFELQVDNTAQESDPGSAGGVDGY